MAYLDAKAINAKLLAGDKKVELLNYIFKKQGGASCITRPPHGRAASTATP
jgi:hypothetical protein